MKIIEGKQAVLRPCRTEADCVRPQKGQHVQPVEPAACPVTEPSTVECIPLKRAEIPVQPLVKSSPRIISDTEIQKPMDCEWISGNVTNVETREPVPCVPQSILDVELQKPEECIPQTVSERTLQPAKAQVIPAAPEWGQLLEDNMSGRNKRKWLAEMINRIEEGGNI